MLSRTSTKKIRWVIVPRRRLAGHIRQKKIVAVIMSDFELFGWLIGILIFLLLLTWWGLRTPKKQRQFAAWLQNHFDGLQTEAKGKLTELRSERRGKHTRNIPIPLTRMASKGITLAWWYRFIEYADEKSQLKSDRFYIAVDWLYDTLHTNFYWYEFIFNSGM